MKQVGVKLENRRSIYIYFTDTESAIREVKDLLPYSSVVKLGRSHIYVDTLDDVDYAEDMIRRYLRG